MKAENRQQFLVILTIVAVGLYVGVNFICEPLAGLWKSRADKVATLRKQVSDGRMLVKRESAVRSRWSQMLTNTLPSNTSVAEQQVLKAFDNWSSDSGAAINGIVPQWKNDADDYMTLNCRVEASGDIGTLTRLVYDIENDSMALKLESVELSAHDNTGQQLTLGLQVSGLALIQTGKQ
jgi:Tfp pilus assembly protein PilO